MATLHKDEPQSPEHRHRNFRRRGIFSAAAALVAAVVAKVTEQPVEAGTDGDVVLGEVNMAAGNTQIISSAYVGLLGEAGGHGLVGYHRNGGATNGAGVFGESFDAGGYGLFGLNRTLPGTAILGRSIYGLGVLAHTDGGTAALLAQVGTTTGGPTVAVYGANSAQYSGPVPGAGGFGVYGISAKGHGVVGAAVTAGAAAVVGSTNGVAGAQAGTFYGPVVVTGDLTVLGAKSAAVAHPDGTHRRLYCVESPESWFEDVGEATLTCGEASVALDRDFAAVVDAGKYHVFLTGYDGLSGLSVLERSPRGFRVRAPSGADGTFSWRVLAKRKDIGGQRLEVVAIPDEPVLPDVPAGNADLPAPRAVPTVERSSSAR